MRRNALPERPVVSQGLRLDAPHNSLGLGHQVVKLVVAPHVESAKPLKEVGQVLDGRVAEDLGLSVILAGQSLGEMRHEFRKLVDERFLGQPHSLLEAGRHAGLFLLE